MLLAVSRFAIAVGEPRPAPHRRCRIHHLPLYSIQMVAKSTTILYGGAEDGVKASGKRAFPMVSRSWLFSGTERRAAALLPPHCFRKPPHAADRPVYHPRLPHMENGLENRFAKKGGGLPACRRVASRMMKIHASGLAICMDRAGVASTHNLA